MVCTNVFMAIVFIEWLPRASVFPALLGEQLWEAFWVIVSVKFVSVPTQDQDRALAFYMEKLGFRLITDQPFGPDQRWIELGIGHSDTRFVLFTPPGDEDNVGQRFSGALACDDVEATYPSAHRAWRTVRSAASAPGLGHVRYDAGFRRQSLRSLVANLRCLQMTDKSVAERLQVKGLRRLAVLGASPDLDRAVGLSEVRAEVALADVLLFVAPDRARLEAGLPKVLAAARPTAILWVAYPKLSSSLASDLSRDAIRALAPRHGLDTVSQIAIDEDWSAMRLKRV